MTKTTTPPSPLRIAVIGGGPGGIFFCHALETYRRELQAAGNSKALALLPIVTCFERGAPAGGVWRSERTFVQNDKEDSDKENVSNDDSNDDLDLGNKSCQPRPVETTNMYEALWLNGCKEPIEFFDYTYQEHFGGRPLPTYLPRAMYLDYMMGRVTKHCPDFFDKYIQCNTSVVKVKQNDNENSNFQVTTENHVTNQVATACFDKVIWAAGQNGKPNMPKEMLSMLRLGGFKGRMIHSTDTDRFQDDVKDKRVLLVGGGYSAEDLALMAIKCQAKRVYISSRSNTNVVTWMTSWPQDKVELLNGQAPVAVAEHGRVIQFAKTKYVFLDKYETGSEIVSEVRDIDTIIFCTGYAPNLDMLDKELRKPLLETHNTKQLSVPANWKMKPNPVSNIIGDVVPGDVRWPYTIRFPDLWRGVVIDNPNMMVLENEWFPFPLTGIDIHAWALMRIVTGKLKVPSKEEMKKQNLNDALDSLQIPYLRYCVDKAYQDAYWSNTDPHESSLSYYDRAFYKSRPEYTKMHYRLAARVMKEIDYPMSYGSYEEINRLAQMCIDSGTEGYYHRSKLHEGSPEERSWRTFRDVKHVDRHVSIFTGAVSVPLKGKWLEMDANGETILD